MDMSIESKIGKALRDSNDVVKNRINENVVLALRDNQINIGEDQLDILLRASHTAIDQVGLNVVSTIARMCNQEIASANTVKSSRSKRKK